MNDVTKKLAKAGKKCKLTKAAEAKAKSRTEVAEVKVVQLKDKLKKIEAVLASKKKERLEVQAKAIDVERKTQKQVAEAGCTAVKAFCAKHLHDSRAQERMMKGWTPTQQVNGPGHHTWVMPNGEIKDSPKGTNRIPFVFHAVPKGTEYKWRNRKWYTGSFILNTSH